jgi:hypothetical protein
MPIVASGRFDGNPPECDIIREFPKKNPEKHLKKQEHFAHYIRTQQECPTCPVFSSKYCKSDSQTV